MKLAKSLAFNGRSILGAGTQILTSKKGRPNSIFSYIWNKTCCGILTYSMPFSDCQLIVVKHCPQYSFCVLVCNYFFVPQGAPGEPGLSIIGPRGPPVSVVLFSIPLSMHICVSSMISVMLQTALRSNKWSGYYFEKRDYHIICGTGLMLLDPEGSNVCFVVTM